MGSKQKNSLTHEASLGACLGFAGQVLSSSLPPSQVCTKEVLSAIVVEAHRFGQQVGKSCGAHDNGSSSALGVDPRKLLKKLQTHQSEPEWDRAGVQIDRLAFEDMTWDSQGDVAQTLEMELLELEKRAVESNLSVCVLLTLRAAAAVATSAPESAILWFPLSIHQGSSNNSSNGKKQYLLYACPGRIKVVKSVVELFKKMREEIKLMDESVAVYSVWTLTRSSISQVKKKQAAAAAAAAAGASNQQREADEASTEMEDIKRSAVEAQPPRSHRAMAIRPAQREARVLPVSIFSFPTESVVRAQAKHVETSESMLSKEDGARECKAVSLVAVVEALGLSQPHEEISFNQRSGEHDSPELKTTVRLKAVSSSFSGGFQAQPRSEEQAASVWQSLDSDAKNPRWVAALKAKSHLIAGDLYETAPADKDQVVSASENSVLAKEDPGDEDLESLVLMPTGVSAVETTPFAWLARGSLARVAIDQDRAAAAAAAAADCRKPEPARRNFKAKLGNRVWWELQCAAEKLQQQQQSVDPVERAARPERKRERNVRTEKETATRSPPSADDDNTQTQHRHSKRVEARSDARPPVADASPLPRPVPPEIILDEDFNSPATSAAPVCSKTVLSQGARLDSSSVNRSTKRELLLEEVLERNPFPSVKLAHGTDKTSSRVVNDPSSSDQVMLEAQQRSELSKSLFKKTALLQQDPGLPSEASSKKTPVSLRNRTDSVQPETLNRDAEVPKTCKDVEPTPSSHPDRSTKCVECPKPGQHKPSCPDTEATKSRRKTVPIEPPKPVSAGKGVANSRGFEFYPDEQIQTSESVAASGRHTNHSTEVRSELPWSSSVHQSAYSCDSRDVEDDDDLVQSQWASSRTSYAVERERRREELNIQTHSQPQQPAPNQKRSETAATPFNIHGRVPIRATREVPLAHRSPPQFEDEDSSSDDEDDFSNMDRFDATPRRSSQPARRASALEADPERHEDVEPKQIESKSRVAVERKDAQHVATFITLDKDTKISSKRARATSTAIQKHPTLSREERLAELRQRKLQQLHKAREEQQQQQEQKKKKTSLLLQRQKSISLAAQAGLLDDTSIPTNTPGKATSANTHLRAAKRPSNKKLIQNALEYTLLAGFSMEKERAAALSALAQSSCDNFIVLLKSTKDLKFRALYEHHTDRQEVVKLFASTPNAPMTLSEDTIGQFFKYNSGKKEFVAIDSRAFTMKTDACALKDELVFKKKAALGKLL